MEKGNKPQVLHPLILTAVPQHRLHQGQVLMMKNSSVSEMVNKVATEYWIYGSTETDLVNLKVHFLNQKGGGDNIHSLRKAGEPEGLVWAVCSYC